MARVTSAPPNRWPWFVAAAVVVVLGAVAFVRLNRPSAAERSIQEQCLERGTFTAQECECMAREARKTADLDVDSAAERCAPSMSGSSRRVGVILAKVTSLPEGATVFVDGKATNQRTPTEVELVSDTSTQVEVRLDGYLPQQRVVSYRVGDPAQLSFTLDPAASLKVTTQPAGARVSLAKSTLIERTPGEARGLQPGATRVVIQSQGHVSVVREVMLEAAKTLAVEETLVPAAYVEVTSTPPGASVEVDGLVVPEMTPTPVPVVPGKKHVVVVSLPEHTSVKRVVVSGAAGTTSAFAVTLADTRLQNLTRARTEADRALAKAELALERAKERHEAAELRGAVTAALVKALENAEDAVNRAQDRANEALSRLDEYETQKKRP